MINPQDWGQVVEFTDDPGNSIQTYRTNSGRFFWTFEFVRVGRSWRIYILRGPGYGNRDTDAHSTHRYYDSRRRQHYICFDPEPSTLYDAYRVASAWAERSEAYILRGQRF